MSLRYVTLLSSGCAPTVCLATGFVAFFPVLHSPAGSGCVGSCGFSFPIWFTTFVMRSPLRGRGWFALDRNEGLVCFSFPFGLFLRVATVLRGMIPSGSSVLVGSHLCATYVCHWWNRAMCFALYTSRWASSLSLRPVATGAFPGGPRWGRDS